MYKSQKNKKYTAIFAALTLFLSTCYAQSPINTPDPVNLVPIDSFFAVKISNLDKTTGQIDQFISGISPVPVTTSMLIRMQLANIMGDPMLKGINTTGDFVIFGPLKTPVSPDSFDVGLLMPVTSYQDFLSAPNVSEPDGNGVSTITAQVPMPLMSVKAGDYALIGMGATPDILTAKAAQITKTKMATLGSMLTESQKQQSSQAPIWAYLNVPAINKSQGENIRFQIEGIKSMMTGMSDPNDPSMRNAMLIMDIYANMINSFLEQAKSVSLTIEPKPDVLTISKTISALPNTEMAKLLVGSGTKKPNFLIPYLDDGAAMNLSMYTNTPFMKKMNELIVDAIANVCSGKLTSEEIADIKLLMQQSNQYVDGPAVFTLSIAENSTPPMEMKYVLKVKDYQGYKSTFQKSEELMNKGGIHDFYKQMGIDMNFSMNENVMTHNSVSIDSAKLSMKSTMPATPQGMIIESMYGDGFEYKWAAIGDTMVCSIGANNETNIKKLIDQTKSGKLTTQSEIAQALKYLPGADSADFLLTYNYLRIMKMVSAMPMPMPMQMPKIDIPTKSNLIFAGNIYDGEATFQVAVPKEHVMEIVSGMMQMQQQMMMQMQQQQDQNKPSDIETDLENMLEEKK